MTADLHQCRCDVEWLTNAYRLGDRCLQVVEAAGLTCVAKLFHAFPPTDLGAAGVTATVLLAESHLCVHTWPEQQAVTLDVYVCNFGGDHSAKATALMDALVALFDPVHATRNALQRGQLVSPPGLGDGFIP